MIRKLRAWWRRLREVAPPTSPAPTPSPAPQLHRVVPLLYVPAGVEIDEAAYVVGIDSAMAEIRAWYSLQLGGPTFTLAPCRKVRGTVSAEWFATAGMKEATQEVVLVSGLDPADDHSLFVSCAAAPIGFLGGTIGIDNYRTDAENVPTWPWPGRTGLMGRGLELFATGFSPESTTEWWADERREWLGAIAHELGHAICGLEHVNEPPNIMFGWWDFPATNLLPEHRARVLASPFVS